MFKPAVLLLASTISLAQAQQISSITAIGTSQILVQPDEISLNLTVTTQAGKAKDAASRNADQIAAVRAALAKILDPGAHIKTVTYSMQRGYPSGFSVHSTIEVTSDMPSLAGSIIDAAVAAGATAVADVKYRSKDPDLAHQQALQAATEQAKSHAAAMARGLGRSVGPVLSLQESTEEVGAHATDKGTYFSAGRRGIATPTALESAPVDVQVSVVLQVQLN